MSTEEVFQLRERAKELRCLYQVHEILSQRGQPPNQAFLRVLTVIPDGWQRPESAGARIAYMGRSYVGPGYSSSCPSISQPIRMCGIEVGTIEVSDAAALNPGVVPFLSEETVLLRNIAHRIGEYLEWKHTELLGERVGSPAVHWRWRESYARALSSSLDAERFGVSGIYLGGSTENGSAGPGSDIDLFILFHGSQEQRSALNLWLEGWSLCLAEFSFQQTGYAFRGGILNVQLLDSVPDSTRTDLRELPVGLGGRCSIGS